MCVYVPSFASPTQQAMCGTAGIVPVSPSACPPLQKAPCRLPVILPVCLSHTDDNLVLVPPLTQKAKPESQKREMSVPLSIFLAANQVSGKGTHAWGGGAGGTHNCVFVYVSAQSRVTMGGSPYIDVRKKIYSMNFL